MIRIGGADESPLCVETGSLGLARALKGKIAYLGEPLNYFRSHDKSVRRKTRDQGLDVAEDLQGARWILGQVTPTDAVLRMAIYELSIGFRLC